MDRRWNAAALEDALDLDSLLHPAHAFDRPSDVVHDPDLTLNEKRAILASWASDACAMEAAPGLRHMPGGKIPVPFDDVIDALRALDKQACAAADAGDRRRARRRRVGRGDTDTGDQGAPLH